ncbi:MAG: hypothetical protein EHM35_06680 [Planctomycetaceae bacterium]|jgi:hypothetical protein|nr:MAG: hypothetical protein EHM35_06680 [Planctomycetaceae bacterium]
MAEPLFFDCLTDAQIWSLFDAGVLHGYMVPVEVYARLRRIAPDHGYYLFTWPAGVDLPSLQDIVPGLAGLAGEPPTHTPSSAPEMRLTVEQMRLAIAAFCGRVQHAIPPEGGRIHVLSANPRPELRAGPYLEPQAHELSAMSLPELEAYLDDVLRLDEDNDRDAVASTDSRSAQGPFTPSP